MQKKKAWKVASHTDRWSRSCVRLKKKRKSGICFLWEAHVLPRKQKYSFSRNTQPVQAYIAMLYDVSFLQIYSSLRCTKNNYCDDNSGMIRNAWQWQRNNNGMTKLESQKSNDHHRTAMTVRPQMQHDDAKTAMHHNDGIIMTKWGILFLHVIVGYIEAMLFEYNKVSEKNIGKVKSIFVSKKQSLDCCILQSSRAFSFIVSLSPFFMHFAAK